MHSATTKNPHACPQWQPLNALCGTWIAFGEVDEKGQRYMSEAALESIYLDSHVPGWVEGRVRFGFKQIKPAIVALGDETGLRLPTKVKNEIPGIKFEITRIIFYNQTHFLNLFINKFNFLKKIL